MAAAANQCVRAHCAKQHGLALQQISRAARVRAHGRLVDEVVGVHDLDRHRLQLTAKQSRRLWQTLIEPTQDMFDRRLTDTQ